MAQLFYWLRIHRASLKCYAAGMIPQKMQIEIHKRLEAAEKEHNVRILYAIESGSRAWGFASPNSDYDVRFIYAHPQDWYLSIEKEQQDVIEYPIVDEIDINGWDIRKALRLFKRSNPALVEWLLSSIVYRDDGFFHSQALALLPEIYSVEKGIYHYRSMALNNYQNFLTKETVLLKKYFYVLRPLLAIRWLEHRRTPAPIEFDLLRFECIQDVQLINAIEELVEQKKQALEKAEIPQIPILQAFIESELARLSDYNEPPKSHASALIPLNALFRKVLIPADTIQSP